MKSAAIAFEKRVPGPQIFKLLYNVPTIVLWLPTTQLFQLSKKPMQILSNF